MRSDAELLEAWRGGQLDAGEALFDRYYESVYRFFGNKVSEDSRDLVQQTFMACVEGRDRVRESGSFRSYLFATAHNVLRTYLRAKHGLEPVDLDSVTVHELAPGPSSLTARRSQERLLLEALRSIPIEQQLVLELRYWEQLRTAEIAEILGLPANTVRSRLHRAQDSLRAVLERLASSPAALESTLASLDDWARQCSVQLGTRGSSPTTPR